MKLSALDIAGLVLAALLLMCLASLPYGYYIFVRFCTTMVMVCYCVKYAQKKQLTLAVMSGAIALLFQPFFKLSLGRAVWNILDVAVAIGLVVSVFVKITQKGE